MPPSKDDPRPNPLAAPSDYLTSVVHSETYKAISPLKSNLYGKAVFISGASKGLGHALTISFARAGASQIALGARSDLNSVKEAALTAASVAKRPAPQILTIQFDVTSRESVENAAQQVDKEFGRLDIVVNNAGIVARGKLVDSDPDEWWKVWTVNVHGPYLVARSFIPLLLKTTGGQKVVCNVASVGAHLTGPGLSAYQPSKTALIRLSDFIQAEYGSEGIISFSTHPGNMVTEIFGEGGVPEGLAHGELCLFLNTPL